MQIYDYLESSNFGNFNAIFGKNVAFLAILGFHLKHLKSSCCFFNCQEIAKNGPILIKFTVVGVAEALPFSKHPNFFSNLSNSFNRQLKDCLEKTGKILFSKTGKNSDTRLLQKLNTRQVSVEEFTV